MVILYALGYFLAVFAMTYYIFKFTKSSMAYSDDRIFNAGVAAIVLIPWPITGPLFGMIILGKYLGTKHAS